MSRLVERLAKARKELDHLLRDGVLARALDHAEAWAEDEAPAVGIGHQRGGSSSPTETRERAEVRQVRRRARFMLEETPTRIAAIEREVHRLLADVLWATVATPQRPDDADDALAGCKSCARLRGHREPVDDRYKRLGLCRWCGDRLEEFVEIPVPALDVRFGQSANAATRWLSRNVARARSSVIGEQ